MLLYDLLTMTTTFRDDIKICIAEVFANFPGYAVPPYRRDKPLMDLCKNVRLHIHNIQDWALILSLCRECTKRIEYMNLIDQFKGTSSLLYQSEPLCYSLQWPCLTVRVATHIV